MNQDLPKPMFDVLARQALPTEHPSADVLTAFTEKALAGDEYRRIADHLARCRLCREVIFLSLGASDTVLEDEQEAAASNREWRRWMPRLVWGASIAAGVLLVASALVWWRMESAQPRMQIARREASVPAAQPAQPTQATQPATPLQPEAELRSTVDLKAPIESNPATTPPRKAELPVPSLAVAKPQSKETRAKLASPRGAEALGEGTSAGIVADANPAPTKSGPTTPSGEAGAVVIGGAPPAFAPAAPYANSFAEAQGGPAAATPGSANAVLMNPQTALRSVRALHLQWRITSDGRLEHLTAAGWSRVLANQAAKFRVVSSVGDHVWVGGSGGALFHSRDDGQSWDQVALNTANGHDTGAIVSIEFDDPQHGMVTTDRGARCVTTDGGGHWNCQ